MKICPIMYRMGIVYYEQEQGEEYYGPRVGDLSASPRDVWRITHFLLRPVSPARSSKRQRSYNLSKQLLQSRRKSSKPT